MCCRTNSFCCCGNDMRKGIMIAGIVDLILLIALTAVNIALQGNYLSLWFVIVIIGDVLLIIGSKENMSGLLMVWMIIGMINIVFLFIAWIALPVWGFITVFVTAVCNDEELTGNGVDCEGTENYLLVGFILNAIFIFGLPIYYIYLWVAVKSHRENLMQGQRNMIQPMQMQQGIFQVTYWIVLISNNPCKKILVLNYLMSIFFRLCLRQ